MAGSPLYAQAAADVAATYKPAEKELNYQAQRVQAVDAKRKRDNAAFATWAAQKQAQLTAGANSANAALDQAGQHTQSDLAMYNGAIASQLQQHAAQNPAGYQGLGNSAGDVATAMGTGQALVASQRTGANERATEQAALRNFQENNAAGYASAREQQRQGDTAAAQQQIEQQRLDLTTQKAKDTLDRSDTLESSAAAAAKAAQDRADRMALAQLAHSDRVSARKQSLNIAQANLTQRQKEEADRLLNKAGPKSLSPTEVDKRNQASNKVYTGIQGIVDTLKHSKPKKGQTLRQFITNSTKDPKSPGMGASGLYYELGLDVYKNGYLSPVNVARAKRLGLQIPADWMPPRSATSKRIQARPTAMPHGKV